MKIKKNQTKNGRAFVPQRLPKQPGVSTTTATTTTTNNKNHHIPNQMSPVNTSTTQPPPQQQQQQQQPTLVMVAETRLPTVLGEFRLRAYRYGDSHHTTMEPCVIYSARHPLVGGGDGAQPDGSSTTSSSSPLPIRVHDQCMTSEVFGSQRCDCKEQLQMAMRYIDQHGGLIIYLQQEGRGIGFANKIAAYALQDQLGLDTVDANLQLGFPDDLRVYDVVPLILDELGLLSTPTSHHHHRRTLALLTNNPRKVQALQRLGLAIDVDATIPLVVPHSNVHNHQYLLTKRDRSDHMHMDQLVVQRDDDNDSDAAAAYDNRNTATGTTGEVGDPVRVVPTNVDDNRTDRSNTNNIVRDDDDDSNNSKDDDDDDNSSNSSNNNNDDKAIVPPQQPQEQLGVVKRADGYCFGKQTVIDAIAAIARGEMVVVVDDMDRENEGDFIMAADLCTADKMAEIIRYSSGVVCVAISDDDDDVDGNNNKKDDNDNATTKTTNRLQRLQLPTMVVDNQDPKGTAFCVSVDATKAHGITTGISAEDRSITVRLLADPSATAKDFARPGHLFPLRARPGGVLTRDGHTEATVDLARLAGRAPVGILCEIVSEDHPTEMMRLPEMKRFAEKRGYVLTSIADLIQYRKETGQ